MLKTYYIISKQNDARGRNDKFISCARLNYPDQLLWEEEASVPPGRKWV
jgi:hypothetical protein